MLARTHSVGLSGIEGFMVTAESAIGPGLPGTLMVGVTGGQLLDAIERVGGAIRQCGHPLPQCKEIVNLAPAGKRKDNSGFELAMACSLLISHNVIPAESLADTLLWGKVAAEGRLLAANGALVAAETACRHGFRRMLVAAGSASEVASLDLEVLPVSDLAELVAHLRGERPLATEIPPASVTTEALPDMADLRGLAHARRAVELMIAGGHGLVLQGPKSAETARLIERIPGLLVELDESLTHTRAKLASVVGEHVGPPFRLLPPETKPTELIAGVRSMRPGPASLAHGGVLVLDDLARFPRPLLDAVDDVSRGSVRGVYPAKFVVMATVQPSQSHRYARLLERIDLVVDVERPAPGDPTGESSEAIRSRIALARARQHERWRGSDWALNGQLPRTEPCMNSFCRATQRGMVMLDQIGKAERWCFRRTATVLRVARTVADLDANLDPRAPIDSESILAVLSLSTRPSR